MAQVDTLIHSFEISQLQKSNGTPSMYLSDQRTAEFGSSRYSEIMAKLPSKGRSFEEAYVPYINGL